MPEATPHPTRAPGTSGSLRRALSPRAERLIDCLYGGLVPPGEPARAGLLHRAGPPAWPGQSLESWRVEVGAPAWVTWTLQVLRPSKPTPAVPVVLTGDACWGHPDDAVRRLFADSGVALAWFNRTELAHDAPDAARAGPVFDRYPQARFGAIAAWAWGLGRSVDVLRQIPGIDAACVSVVGHSRGGKAALLAGAADSRIWMTAAHNSGTGGAASSVVTDAGAETLADLARTFPHWLGRDAAQLMATGSLQGLDQHLLLARIAPRRLLLIQARDDAWANPEGLRAAARRAAAAWRSTGAAGGLRVVWRDGGHAMGLADWRVVARVVAQASV